MLGVLVLLVALVLGVGRSGERGGREEESEPLHAASPSRGRTVTTRIIPACM